MQYHTAERLIYEEEISLPVSLLQLLFHKTQTLYLDPFHDLDEGR